MKLLMFFVISFTTTMAYGATVKLDGSGTSTGIVTGDPEMGGPLSSMGSNTTILTGSLGKTHSTGLTKLGEWDGFSFCELEPGVPGLLIAYVSGSAVDTAANGDQLYRQLADTPASTLCFNFNDESFTFTIHTNVIGGTGRFRGASGSVVVTGSGQTVAEGLSAFSSSYRGNLD